MGKKHIKSLICIILSFLFFSNIILAHAGKTDINGGHYNTTTNEYHYHHGYSAHYHINGICPYNYTNRESNDIKGNKEGSHNMQYNKLYTKNTTYSDATCIFLTSFTCIFCILVGLLLYFLYKYIDTNKILLNNKLLTVICCIIFIASPFIMLGIFTAPFQIFDSFKSNALVNLFFPCINIILFIPLIYYWKNY